MKFLLSNIAIITLLFFSNCSDRSLLTDPNDPGLGGNFTIISDEVSGTLLKSKSPYYVTKNITINDHEILNIEAGTIIFFKTSTGLFINGGIRAIGSKEESILFKSIRNEWNGIHSVDPTDSLIFTFCRIEGVYLPLSSSFKYGALDISNANLIITNCIFYYNYAQYGGALAISFCSSEIANNIFYDNGCLDYGGAILSKNSSNRIINNTFYKNSCYNIGGAITIIDPLSEEIQNNIFSDNSSYHGDKRIHFVAGDSTKIFKQFNFLDPDSLFPLFISETDFHLQENSPCKNAGNPALEFNDNDGSRNDQGAYGGPGGTW
jgi:hypothetical protein